MSQNDVAGSYQQLLESVLSLLETSVAWIRQELEAAVRDKVVKPLIAAGATVAVLSTVLSAIVLTGVVLFAVGCTLWLGYAIGNAAAAVVVGTILLAVCGSGLAATIKAAKRER
jgi:hypothetical protein